MVLYVTEYISSSTRGLLQITGSAEMDTVGYIGRTAWAKSLGGEDLAVPKLLIVRARYLGVVKVHLLRASNLICFERYKGAL